MSGRWVTVKDACHALDMTERTLRRHIQQGKIKSRVEDRRRYVLVEDTDTGDHDSVHGVDMTDHNPDHVNGAESEYQSELIQQLKSENEYLRSQVEEKDQQINQQQAIIMQLSRNQQLMLESSQMKERRGGWWSGLFRRVPKSSS